MNYPPMRRIHGRILGVVALLAALVATMAAAPGSARRPVNSALADDCSAGATPFSITDVQPRKIANSSATTLVVTLDIQVDVGPAAGATVVLDGFGGLTTAPAANNSYVLNASVPPGIPAKKYDVQVVLGDGSCQTFSDSIKVVGPTETPKPTSSPQPTGTSLPTAYIRPAINVDSYGASSPVITPGTDFDFEMTVVNRGEIAASNITLDFVSGDISPRDTGGVQTSPGLAPGESWRLFQPMRASDTLWGSDTGTVTVNASYYDVNGETYNDSFTLTFQLMLLGNSPTPTLTPTPSATPSLNPRLLIGSYDTGPNPVAPGDQFNLSLQVKNVGNATAKGVTMIFSGGQTSSSSGTPSAGGDFSDFAPQNGSNVRFVGDVSPGQTMTVAQTLVVNGSALSGAYPVDFSFVYVDEYGQSHTDQQVITILVVSVPKLEISFYEEAGPFVAGESGVLPLQVVNHGLNSIVLGGMKVEGQGAQFKNNLVLVGALDPGSYFTLDAIVVPSEPGPLSFDVTIDYTDAFNRTQVISQTLQIIAAGSLTPTPEPGAASAAGQAGEGGFFQTVWRAILGFLGIGG